MDITKEDFIFRPNETSFYKAYSFWVNNLFERCARLFVWKNTGTDLDGGVDPIHIEKPALKYGKAIDTLYKGRTTLFKGSYYGVTVYDDRFTHVNVSSPLYAGKRTIGKDCVIIRNNSCETSICHLVHRYAVMLAHAECTLVTLLVNARVSSVPAVNNTKEKTLIDQWRNGVYNGKIGTIVDSGFLSVKWQDINTHSLATLQEVWELRENILNSFYNSIGVRTTWNKKGNMIADEVGGNDSMLLFNINDMLECRKRGADDHNKMFGGSWEVDKCEELKYNDAVTVDKEANTDGVIHD